LTDETGEIDPDHGSFPAFESENGFAVVSCNVAFLRAGARNKLKLK